MSEVSTRGHYNPHTEGSQAVRTILTAMYPNFGDIDFATLVPDRLSLAASM